MLGYLPECQGFSINPICNQGVAGSSPAVGTIDFKDLAIHFRSLLVPLREFCGRPLQNAVQHDQFW